MLVSSIFFNIVFSECKVGARCRDKKLNGVNSNSALNDMAFSSAYPGRSSTIKRCLALLSLATAFTTSEALQVGSNKENKHHCLPSNKLQAPRLCANGKIQIPTRTTKKEMKQQVRVEIKGKHSMASKWNTTIS